MKDKDIKEQEILNQSYVVSKEINEICDKNRKKIKERKDSNFK